MQKKFKYLILPLIVNYVTRSQALPYSAEDDIFRTKPRARFTLSCIRYFMQGKDVIINNNNNNKIISLRSQARTRPRMMFFIFACSGRSATARTKNWKQLN